MKSIKFFLDRWIPELVPHVLTAAAFVAGSVLLFSGATPPEESRLMWLKVFLPLPVLELSHFLGSLAGVGLLVLARGLQKRLDTAYQFTVFLLGAGILFSLLKGVDYEEASILAVMLFLLLPSRRYFYRKTSFVEERFSIGWTLSVLTVLISSVWIGFFSYKHIEYSGDLWWQFTFTAHAPRFLRASVGAAFVLLLTALTQLFRPSRPVFALPSPEELEKARVVVGRAMRPYANLVFLGDKAILFSPSGNSFLMYGIQGRSWVALGDPVGEDAEIPELLWKFHEMCDRHGGWTVFSEVGREYLHLYLDMGFNLLKIGEEARVRLESFSMEGGARKDLRYGLRHLEKEGCVFEIVPAVHVPPLFPELKAISDAWLRGKRTREKRFSLGFFSEDYLKRFPVAIVKKEGRILAFTNLLLTEGKEEFSLDLMRYRSDAPHGMMDYLFTQVMLWGKEAGYQWFNMGMVPLAGLQNRALASLWNRVGALMFKHGESFYNFQGLKEYKGKFSPVWEPKYLASPGGLSVPRVLTDIATLNSGGFRGVFVR